MVRDRTRDLTISLFPSEHPTPILMSIVRTRECKGGSDMRRKKSRKKSWRDEFPSEERREDGNERGKCQYMEIWNRVETLRA